MAAVCTVLLVAVLQTADAKTWVVDALGGSDASSHGDARRPFRTLERARAAVAASWPDDDAVDDGTDRCVLLRGGEHAPLQLSAADSGRSKSQPVVYAAWPGERAVISGGFRIPPAAVKVVPHPRPRKGAAALPVLHVALGHFGFGPAEYGALASDTFSGAETNPRTPGEFGCANQKMEVHVASTGAALALARYPDPFKNGTWRWMNLDRPAGWSPACAKPSRHPQPCSGGGCCASNGSFLSNAADPRPAGWAHEPDPWLHGFFQFDWADTIARVAAITPAASGNGSVDVKIDDATPTYGTKPIQSGARWVGLNLLSELDDVHAGEYWLDRTAGDLYVMPPGGATTGAAAQLGLVVSVSPTCVNSSASNVRFENLEIRYAQGSGMVLHGDSISVINCSISNHGALGVSVHGVGNVVQNCSVHDVGCAGVAVYAGKRNDSLVQGHALVHGNNLHRFAQWKHMYQPGIAFDAVGSNFTNNTMYDAPHSGMLGHANNCRFDSNNFTQLCTESGDAGAFYTGRSWCDRGNSITNNHFERIRNFGKPIPLQKQNVHAIHFDDQMSGYLVDSNHFVDSWVGIMNGGGRRNIITRNTFERIDHAAIEFANRGMTWQNANCNVSNATNYHASFFRQLTQDKVSQPPWSTAYPYLQHIKSDSPCVPVYNNMSYNRYCDCDTFITSSAADIAKWKSTAVGNVNTTCKELHRLKTDEDVEATTWYDAREQLQLRQAGPWPTYRRLPPEAAAQVRSEVWADAQDSAGLVVHFKASGAACSSLFINATMYSASLDMPHMPATGVSGFDLYALDTAAASGDGMRWVANYVPPWGDHTKVPAVGSLVSGLKPGLDRFALYLPLYNGVTSLSIGAPAGCTLSKPGAEETELREGKGAVLVYGTSITQGGVVSRPGNAWTNVIGRLLDRSVYNFGFSGNGEMELNVTQFLLRVPNVTLIIIDCSQNMPGARVCGEGLNSTGSTVACAGASAISYRAPRLVKYIRSFNNGQHKTTPIVLSSGSSWATDWATLKDPSFTAISTTFSAALAGAYKQIHASGDEHVSYHRGGTALDAGDAYSLGNDTNSAAGCHPTDLGHYRFAKIWKAVLAPILDNVSAPLPYQEHEQEHPKSLETTTAACAEGPTTPDHPTACPAPPPITWHDAASLGLTGVASYALPEGKRSSPYQRFPDAMKAQVSAEVWQMSLQSPGEFLVFTTDSKHIYLNMTLQLKYKNYESLMRETGHSGSDLYTLDEESGEWLWIGSNFAGFFGASSATTVNSEILGAGALPKMAFRRIDGLPDSFFSKPRSYMLYLPLYNGPVSATVGVDAGSAILPDVKHITSFTSQAPIVWVGTSIAQGGAAARPGSQYLNILSRQLQRGVLNAAFAGPGQEQLNITEYVSKMRGVGNHVPAAIVYDCLPDLRGAPNHKLIEPRLLADVALLRATAAHKSTPIILSEGTDYSDAWAKPAVQAETDARRKILRATYAKIVAATGDANLHIVNGSELFGSDPFSMMTVRGTHPNTLGEERLAFFWTRYFKKLLKLKLKSDDDASNTSFVTVQKDTQGVWWFMHRGSKFISKGVNHVNNGGQDDGVGGRESPACKAGVSRGTAKIPGSPLCGDTLSYSPLIGYAPYFNSTQERHGSEAGWASSTARRLKSWNFNTMGGWSATVAERAGAARGLYYSHLLDLGTTWLSHTGLDHDPWNSSFAAQCKAAVAKQVAPRANDEFLLGWQLDNELNWRGLGLTCFLQGYKQLDGSVSNAGKNIAAAFVRDHCAGKASDQCNDQWLGVVAERYFEQTVGAIKSVDRNHLILGMRGGVFCADSNCTKTQPILKATGKYVDVFDYHDYGDEPPIAILETVHRVTGLPVMLGEWSFTAFDSNMPNTGGSRACRAPPHKLGGAPCLPGDYTDCPAFTDQRKCVTVRTTQSTRASDFRRFVTALVKLPFAVGFHWWQWADEPSQGRWPDGECSNYGLVHVSDDVYEVLTQEMTKTNAAVHALHEKS